MKKILIPVVPLLVIVGAGLLLCRGGKNIAMTIGDQKYQLCGSRESGKQELTLLGNIDIRQVSLAFEEDGRVDAMPVQEGDSVQAGQLVATLDTQTLSIQAQQARARLEAQRQTVLELQAGSRPQEIAQGKARLASARAEAAYAHDDLLRLEGISKNTGGRGVSRQELAKARSNDRAARAKVEEMQENLTLLELGARVEERERAKARLKEIQADLDLILHRIELGVLKAPVDAIVRARLLEPGDMASSQKPVYTLALTDPKWVRVYAGEKDLGRIMPGMGASVFTDSRPGIPVEGQVGYISSVAEFTPKPVQTEELRTSLLYEVRVFVKDPENILRMGQPVTVKLHTNE
ncbi:membrane protein [Desulfosarcina widdelii]|uniref:Membrane protein n=1 Tax=Desulfosarcina widdelii TaxID=947919 RepID=A0A5K7YXK3_9BACT|nr:HlyD family efflux transporter periplasmic adaptor subunit [Desulfosarcina widdelii]BBO73070.1 membrane protein [Desulfosarcina widdelii]